MIYEGGNELTCTLPQHYAFNDSWATSSDSFKASGLDKLAKGYMQSISDIINMVLQISDLREIELSQNTAPADILLDNLARLQDISALENDWNGYGAKSFSPELISKCKTILYKLKYQPDIFPTGRQSIQFQYEMEDGSYLEFEIYENHVDCLRADNANYEEAEEWRLSEEAEDIGVIVEEFHGKHCIKK